MRTPKQEKSNSPDSFEQVMHTRIAALSRLVCAQEKKFADIGKIGQRKPKIQRKRKQAG
jgi:hypothetical protein